MYMRKQNRLLFEKHEAISHIEGRLVNVELTGEIDSGVSILVVGFGSTGTLATNEVSRIVRSPQVRVRAFDSAPFQKDKYRYLNAETNFNHLAEPDAETVIRNIELHPLLMERIPDIASNVRDRLAVINSGAGGSRKNGFFLFYRNIEKIRATLIGDITELRKGRRDRHLMVIVVGTSTGGTASSQMIELGYVTRSVLGDMGISDYSMIISPILPITEEERNSGGQLVIKGRANSFKFWQELAYFMKCSEFDMRYGPSVRVKSRRRPYEMIWPIEGSSIEEAVGQVAMVVKALSDGNQAQALLARLEDKRDILIAGQVMGHPLACVAVAERSLIFNPTPLLNQWASEYGRKLLGLLLNENDGEEDTNGRVKKFLKQLGSTAQDIKQEIRQKLANPDFNPIFRYNKQLPAKLRRWSVESRQRSSLDFSQIVDGLAAGFAPALKESVDKLVDAGQFGAALSFLQEVKTELESESHIVDSNQIADADSKEGRDENEKSYTEEDIDHEIDSVCEEISGIVASTGYLLPIIRNFRMSKVAQLTRDIVSKIAKMRKAQWNMNICNAVIGVMSEDLAVVESQMERVCALIRRIELLDDSLARVAAEKVERGNNPNEVFIQLSHGILHKLKDRHFPPLDNLSELIPVIAQKIRDWGDDEVAPGFLAWCLASFDGLVRYTLVDILAEETDGDFDPALEVKQLIESARPGWRYTTAYMESKPPQIRVASIGQTQNAEANGRAYSLLRQDIAENCITQGGDPNRLDVSVYHIGLPLTAWKGMGECQEAYDESERQGDQSYHIFANIEFGSPLAEVAEYSHRAKKAYKDGLSHGILVNGTGEYQYKGINMGRSGEQIHAFLIRNPVILEDLEMTIAQLQQDTS